MVSFDIITHHRTELIDITARVQAEVTKSKVSSGICLIYVPHTTAGITINESYDPAVAEDITITLSKIIPPDRHYKHTEGNADAHIKSVLIGTSQVIPVENGKLSLGRWQGIFFCEFDGPRQRTCFVQIINISTLKEDR
ncbi:MAG: secondary thiamine-phosphate synthase enzyme YjbQ [bacterium]